MAGHFFEVMVKAVVDVERRIIAMDAELHSDLESFLIQNGSRQKDLWGINLHIDATPDDFVEFDSMINIRPAQGNRTRGVNDPALQTLIRGVVAEKIQ